MKLPKNRRELRHLFQNALAPDVNDLGGEYIVDMLTLWPSLKRFSHRKVMQRKNNVVQGYNVLFHKMWGHFVVEEGMCHDVDSSGVAVINYNCAENSPPVRRIRDYVRCIEKNTLYIGRFYYSFPQKLLFLGYFSLEKTGRGPAPAAVL